MKYERTVAKSYEQYLGLPAEVLCAEQISGCRQAARIKQEQLGVLSWPGMRLLTVCTVGSARNSGKTCSCRPFTAYIYSMNGRNRLLIYRMKNGRRLYPCP